MTRKRKEFIQQVRFTLDKEAFYIPFPAAFDFVGSGSRDDHFADVTDAGQLVEYRQEETLASSDLSVTFGQVREIDAVFPKYTVRGLPAQVFAVA